MRPAFTASFRSRYAAWASLKMLTRCFPYKPSAAAACQTRIGQGLHTVPMTFPELFMMVTNSVAGILAVVGR